MTQPFRRRGRIFEFIVYHARANFVMTGGYVVDGSYRELTVEQT